MALRASSLGKPTTLGTSTTSGPLDTTRLTGWPGSTGVVWVIDPIDGTTNFIRDLQGFSVSIAARVDGVDSVGVVHDPIRDERFTATAGGGAFCNGTRLRVSSPADLGRSVIATGFNYQPGVRAAQVRLPSGCGPTAQVRRYQRKMSTARNT